MKRIYISPSNIAYFDCLVEDAAAGETNWTVNKNCAPGDLIALYICAPVSAIVATARISSAPVQEDDPHSPWLGKYMADMDNLQILHTPLKRASLLEAFPDWRYFSQPRNSVKVPDDVMTALNKMLHL